MMICPQCKGKNTRPNYMDILFQTCNDCQIDFNILVVEWARQNPLNWPTDLPMAEMRIVRFQPGRMCRVAEIVCRGTFFYLHIPTSGSPLHVRGLVRPDASQASRDAMLAQILEAEKSVS